MWWITLAIALVAAQKDRVPDRVGRVIIVGNTDTPDWVILPRVALRPGQVLDYTQVAAARDRLRRSGLFSESSIEVVPNEFDRGFKDMLVRVEERPGNWLRFAALNTAVGLATHEPDLLWDAADRIARRLR